MDVSDLQRALLENDIESLISKKAVYINYIRKLGDELNHASYTNWKSKVENIHSPSPRELDQLGYTMTASYKKRASLTSQNQGLYAKIENQIQLCRDKIRDLDNSSPVPSSKPASDSILGAQSSSSGSYSSDSESDSETEPSSEMPQLRSQIGGKSPKTDAILQLPSTTNPPSTPKKDISRKMHDVINCDDNAQPPFSQEKPQDPKGKILSQLLLSKKADNGGAINKNKK